jgi:coenzyme F420-reducing hydrogenase gamma subunit
MQEARWQRVHRRGQGAVCVGPLTQAGCGAICPAFGRGCYGCYGPMETPNATSLADWFEQTGKSNAEIVRTFRLFNAWSWQFRQVSEERERK